MKHISLDEAYKLATKGPLRMKQNTVGYTGHAIRLERPDSSYIYSKIIGGYVPEAIEEHQATAALLAHAFNVLPEVMEALVKASQDLIASHAVDCVLYMEKNPHRPPLNEPSSLEFIRQVLTKASTVEVPE